jgi:preprotein translocase subunit SecG
VAEQRTERKRGYGSKWKKWLLIYLAVGAVVYAIIYFVFLSHGGGYGGGGSGGGGGGYFLLAPSMSLLARMRRR